MREAILLFGGGAVLAPMRRALLPLKVMVRPIEVCDYRHSVGYLAGEADCPRSEEAYAGPEFPQPMLVLAGFGQKRLDLTLAALRKAGLRLPYKAVLTPTNRQWTPLDLYGELVKEHEAMAKLRPIHPPREQE